MLIHGDVLDVYLVGPKNTERSDVRRSLSNNHVTGIAENSRDQVQGHLRSDGDNDVIGVRGDSLQPDHFADLFAQSLVTVATAVLQRDLSASGQHVGDSGADCFHGKRSNVGHSASQRNHLRARGDGKKGPDFTRGHAVGALGIPGQVRVKPVSQRGFAGLGRHVTCLQRRTGAKKQPPPGGMSRSKHEAWGQRTRIRSGVACSGVERSSVLGFRSEQVLDSRGDGFGHDVAKSRIA